MAVVLISGRRACFRRADEDAPLLVLLALGIFPLAMQAIDGMFYVSFASRVLIYAIAATSLNLVLGYGGMVSFGHAAFFGAGAYVVGILVAEGVRSAWIALAGGGRGRGARRAA